MKKKIISVVRALFWGTTILVGLGVATFIMFQFFDFFYDRYGMKGSLASLVFLIWIILVGGVYKACKLAEDKDNDS